MAVYIAIRVPEIPTVGQVQNGAVVRIQNASDDIDALQQAAAILAENGSTPAVYGVTLASNITRRVVTPTTTYAVI